MLLAFERAAEQMQCVSQASEHVSLAYAQYVAGPRRREPMEVGQLEEDLLLRAHGA
jgi:hypothetical protein